MLASEDVNIMIQELVRKIVRFRKVNNFSQKEFCEPLHINAAYWAQIEQGKKSISLDKLLDICKHYKLNPSDLIDWEDPEDTAAKRAEIEKLLDQCDYRKLEIVHTLLRQLVHRL